MIHGKSKQFVGLVIAELQHGLFHFEPVEIVLHVLRGDAPECSVNPFLEPVVQGIDVLDMVKSPLDVPAKVSPDYDMFNTCQGTSARTSGACMPSQALYCGVSAATCRYIR